MKVKFTIKKGKETFKESMFKKTEVDMYDMTATFIPTEEEKKIFNDHPLFHDHIFMEYNEVDTFRTGLIFTKDESVDRTKRILVSEIYNSPTFTFKAYSIGRILELRSLILEAGDRFASSIKVLSALEGSEEVEFKPNE